MSSRTRAGEPPPCPAPEGEGKGNSFVILPAPGAEAAAELFATHLRTCSSGDVRVGRVESRRFPDGEVYLRLHDSVEGAHVWVIGTLRDPDPQALTLLFLADTA